MTEALFATETTSLAEADMLALLHQRHSAEAMGARRWVIAEHVPQRPGHADGQRIADFIAIDCYSAPGTYYWQKDARHLVHGFEIKVSRSDWLAELRDPSKAAAFIPYCHHWWLVAASRDVYQPDEIPEGWGVLVPTAASLRIKIRAPSREAEAMPPAMVASFARAVAKTAVRAPERAR